MNVETRMAYSFWDRNDVKGSGHMRWTINRIENMEPTGRWRFKYREGAANELSMEIEIVYTQITKGTIAKKRKKPFLKFFSIWEEYDVGEERKDHGRIGWVKESEIAFMTTYTHECANMGEG